jgi:hypothetical protein
MDRSVFIGPVAYVVSKAADDRLVTALRGSFLSGHVTSVGLRPGLVTTEGVLQFRRDLDLEGAHSPEGVGRVVVALAADRHRDRLDGHVVSVDELADRSASQWTDGWSGVWAALSQNLDASPGRRMVVAIPPCTPIANVHAAHAGVVGIDEPGTLNRVLTCLEAHLQVLTHSGDPLPVGEHFRSASLGLMGNSVLPAVIPSAGGDLRDVELLAQHELIIRLVDADGNDVQGALADFDAGGFHAVVVSRVSSFLGDRISTVTALHVQTSSPGLQVIRLARMTWRSMTTMSTLLASAVFHGDRTDCRSGRPQPGGGPPAARGAPAASPSSHLTI